MGLTLLLSGKKQTIEAHLFDFHENLYGKKITIELLYFLRDEQKFLSVDELIDQLKIDKENAISFLANNPS